MESNENQNKMNDDSVNFFVDVSQDASLQNKSHETIIDFIRAYKNKPAEETDTDWLTRQFAKYPDLWKSEEERRKDAEEIVRTVEGNQKERQTLEKHLNEGRSAESYMASQIEQGAKITGALSVGQYAQRIENAIDEANRAMLDRITTNAGGINANPQLKGFIMETDHVNTFNMDAAAKESAARARANESFGSNSVDITVKNPDGTWHRYQVKCGKDADHANQAFENGSYRGQQKLVSKGQVKDVPNSVDHLESKDGVRSTAKTNAEYEQKQKEFQDAKDPKKVDPGYDWNGINRVAIAKSICRKAAWTGLLAVGFQGARILGRRIWNFITGQENPPVEEDLKEFVISSILSGCGAGFVVALTGGVTVVVKSGGLGTALKATPVGWIANSVCIGIENLKVLLKYGKGEITGEQALDMAARTTLSLAGGLIGGAKGMSIGAAIGTVFGPVGSMIGGFAGGMIGTIAGSTLGDEIYEGAKKIVSRVGDICTDVVRGTCDLVRGAWNTLTSIFA